MNVKKNVPEMFGSMVFNEEVMQQRLPAAAYAAWKQCLTDGTSLDVSYAQDIANTMKEWAIELGATHYTHWFQPMTGTTAEKHDSFIVPDGSGKVLMELSGKELVRGETDASSFPSGGLRACFEARGYTAWDPSSFAFIKNESLYIPTIFCSYSGEALDKKTPLLRSIEVLSHQAVRILHLFGNKEVKKVIPQVGPEQEYFLIDKKAYELREDLVVCGRTLFGAKPPKGQELDDHYYGSIKPRIAAFMQELDEELWKLGILSKTKHNEVAPAQHEMAPIYADANTSCDHNQLTMETMKQVAARHGLVCLLHEKPFAGVNGSGKHNNWSLATDTGKNLFKPGQTPSQNAQFLLFLAAFLAGVDEYQETLRCTVAYAGNDHRLGANEAPPAILSIFLGDELTDILMSIIDGTRYVAKDQRTLRIGVDALPPIPQDTTDRNRTSPIAFTGNKFEFRSLGSSQSISGPNIVLNTIMAEQLRQFADILEKSDNFEEDLQTLIRDTVKAHQRIVFNGNGYSQEWVEESEKRGLVNLSSTVDAHATYMMPKNVELFTKHGIYTEAEMAARHEIHLENYCKVLHIEALTMIDMIRRQIIPAVSAYNNALCDAINSRKAAVAVASCKAEEALVSRLSRLTGQLWDSCSALEKAVEKSEGIPDMADRAVAYRVQVFSNMEKARAAADELESLTAAEYWPFPTYGDILFHI